ncbi:hypothetical protein AVEN_196787-1 [Araneus ventricosus]|uniref:Uncharacterized protein n=1 Tax=Araneus ventricosus TaxID=182803 RepID=A0A4Y2LBG1_ARAVE|nr:hypothetical protein AVEN_196787-1 [Araneus ventricosus]
MWRASHPFKLVFAPIVSTDDESVRSVRLHSKVHETLSITEPGYQERMGINPTEQYPAVLEESSKNIPAKDEFDLDGEETEYSDQKINFETDVEYNPIHEEYSDSN